ncbi:MAG: transposase [Candidatus Competibacteraceae bacterium]|nr:MAG: transposase [Candidatus Competibacteraceae bacterium]
MKDPSPRRRYTPEFKEQAVKRVLLGHGVAAVARDLGISDSLIHNGLARHGQQTGAGAVQAEQATESAPLKRLLVQREEEQSILKKAAAYFVRESR